MKTIKLFSLALWLAMVSSCTTTRTVSNPSPVDEGHDIEMKVFPERNGGAPETLQLTVKNNTDQPIQFGANYTIERLVNGRWVEQDLGNFAVIAIMYGLEPGDSGTYTVSLFTDRVTYPEADYRVVKQIRVGENGSMPYYAYFRIIEPR